MAGKRERSVEERVAEEAAGWVARLQSRDATETDQQAFRAWLRKDPAHQAAYDEFRSLWAELEDVPIAPGRLGKLRTSRRRTTTGIVVLAALAALPFALDRTGTFDRWRADYSTGVGEVRRVTLADGTRVDLNTDTALAVRYAAGERRIELLRGEAFFDVAPEPARPFIVDDGALEARDIGTRYSMRTASGAWPGDVQVEEGRVEVTGAGGQVQLGPGEVATLTPQGQLAVATADVGSATAWRSGKLVFSGRPLRDVLATLERYRRGRIVVLDQAAGDQSVSGVFDLADTDQALRVIEDNLPVRVTRLTDLMVVVRSR